MLADRELEKGKGKGKSVRFISVVLRLEILFVLIKTLFQTVLYSI